MKVEGFLQWFLMFHESNKTHPSKKQTRWCRSVQTGHCLFPGKSRTAWNPAERNSCCYTTPWISHPKFTEGTLLLWRKTFSISEVSFLSFSPTKTRRAEVNVAERWPRVISSYSYSPLHFVWTGESLSLRGCNAPSCLAWEQGPDIYPWRRDTMRCARPKNKESWRRWCLLFVKATKVKVHKYLQNCLS